MSCGVAPKQSVTAVQVCRKLSLSRPGVNCLHPAPSFTRVRTDRCHDASLNSYLGSTQCNRSCAKGSTSNRPHQDPEIDVRAAAKPSKPVTVVDSCITGAICGFVRCRLRARSDGLRSACGSACTADVRLPDRSQRLNPDGLRRIGDAWHQRLPTG